MKIKNILTKIGIITAIIIPPFLVISCNSSQKKAQITEIKDYQVNNFKPLDFNIFKKIGKNQPIFLSGLNYTAYSQGMSFIFNIIKGMGWNWEDANKIENLYNSNFDFNSINIRTNVDSGFTKRLATELEKDFQETFYDSYPKGINQLIEKKASKPLHLVSKLYNQIKSLNYLDSSLGDKILEADALTKVEVELKEEDEEDEDFNKLTFGNKLKRIANKLNNQDIVNKIFNHKKYAYSWGGTILDKLGFQIEGTKIFLWHMSKELPNIIKNINSIRGMNDDLQNLIDDDSLSPQDQKNLSQVVVDPLGADGTMPIRMIYTNLNLKHTSDKSSINKYFELPNISMGKGGQFNWTNGKNKKDEKIQNVASFNSFIDAANPGTIVLKMFEGLASSKISEFLKIKYPLKTFNTKNRIQTFYKVLEQSKINDMVDLIFHFIKFLKNKMDVEAYEIKEITKLVSPVVISLFEFIKNNNISKEDVRVQFNKYNNGSHYILAVEIFLRGMINIPDELSTNYMVPTLMKVWLTLQQFKQKKNEIVGMNNTNNIIAIAFIMFTANKEPKIEGKSSKYYHFNPAILDYAISKKPMGYSDRFILDLNKQKKIGNEIIN